MSVQTQSVEEFSEGIVSLANTSIWRCLTHEVTLKAGQDCPWCMYELLGGDEQKFEDWLTSI